MTFTLDNAVVYDVETLPNCFTLAMECLNNSMSSVWEISEFRNDKSQLITWFDHLNRTQTPMIGFFSLQFDYPIIHFIFTNPQCTYHDIYLKSRQIFDSQDRFGHMIWDRDRFAPQIDLAKVHHFDNRAKVTSLKALEINMRSPTVVDSPVEFNTNLSCEQIDRDLIPYNKHDTKETKRFAHHSMKALNFRIGLIPQFGLEVLNYNDGKIGAKTLEQRLGDAVCFDRSTGRKVMRQTPRYRIPLADIIFPYIHFNNPEFQRVLDYMRTQVLTPEDLDDPEAQIKTKGVFTNLVANVGGLEFYFGTGGVHASVKNQRIIATDEWHIHDIDVEGLYPNIAIKNQKAPEHLGDAFIIEYAKIPIERKTHKKGTYENAVLKLASNVPWGQSNNKYSIFFDPKYAMTIPINGQLMLCMLAEKLATVPTLQMIQVNTDGITYRIHRDYQPIARQMCEQWEAYTCLTLEYAKYGRMWIRDVNNYIAEPLMKPGSNEPPKYKQKGAYWHPDPFNYADSISEASPPCWYKDLGNIVSIRAANAAMTQGIDPEAYIRMHSDPFDFMLRYRTNAADQLQLGGRPTQRTLRYYVAHDGAPLVKISPPKGPLGAYKRKNGLSDLDYARIAATVAPGVHDERIHTKNKSTYQQGVTAIEAGWLVAECNDMRQFSWDRVDYRWYVAEAKKLII